MDGLEYLGAIVLFFTGFAGLYHLWWLKKHPEEDEKAAADANEWPTK